MISEDNLEFFYFLLIQNDHKTKIYIKFQLPYLIMQRKDNNFEETYCLNDLNLSMIHSKENVKIKAIFIPKNIEFLITTIDNEKKEIENFFYFFNFQKKLFYYHIKQMKLKEVLIKPYLEQSIQFLEKILPYFKKDQTNNIIKNFDNNKEFDFYIESLKAKFEYYDKTLSERFNIKLIQKEINFIEDFNELLNNIEYNKDKKFYKLIENCYKPEENLIDNLKMSFIDKMTLYLNYFPNMFLTSSEIYYSNFFNKKFGIQLILNDYFIKKFKLFIYSYLNKNKKLINIKTKLLEKQNNLENKNVLLMEKLTSFLNEHPNHQLYSCFKCGNILLKTKEFIKSNCNFDKYCCRNSLFYCKKCNINYCLYCINYYKNSKCVYGHPIIQSIKTEKEKFFNCSICLNKFNENDLIYSCEQCKIPLCLNCNEICKNNNNLVRCESCHRFLSWKKMTICICEKCEKIKNCYLFCKFCKYNLCLNCAEAKFNKTCGSGHALIKDIETIFIQNDPIKNKITIRENMNIDKFRLVDFLYNNKNKLCIIFCSYCNNFLKKNIFYSCNRCNYLICEDCFIYNFNNKKKEIKDTYVFDYNI